MTDFILGKVHLSCAKHVIEYITAKHFSPEGEVEPLEKKYLYWYVAHDLIYRAKAMNIKS